MSLTPIRHAADADRAPERPPGFWDGVDHAYIPARPGEGAAEPDPEPRGRDRASTRSPTRSSATASGTSTTSTCVEIENLAVSRSRSRSATSSPASSPRTPSSSSSGPCLQYMSRDAGHDDRYILEHRGERDRRRGHVALNDPWVGTAHQPDVSLICPVFHEGKLFCWVANSAHQNDIGGTVPGSFCPNAKDVFWDPPSFPPFEDGRGRRRSTGHRALYRRYSRTPENLALDLRATIAGNNAARARILGLVERTGRTWSRARCGAHSTPASAPSSGRSTRSPRAPTPTV